MNKHDMLDQRAFFWAAIKDEQLILARPFSVVAVHFLDIVGMQFKWARFSLVPLLPSFQGILLHISFILVSSCISFQMMTRVWLVGTECHIVRHQLCMYLRL